MQHMDLKGTVDRIGVAGGYLTQLQVSLHCTRASCRICATSKSVPFTTTQVLEQKVQSRWKKKGGLKSKTYTGTLQELSNTIWVLKQYSVWRIILQQPIYNQS